ncbi:MAG TPA: MOSC domain-containing protein [Bryobacteraceae bacterium]|jgi:MOSC domain-containing protein YiiM
MTGIVVQVSISAGGVPKQAITKGSVTTSGIAGDAWRYPFHGGPKRAILLITSEGIDLLVAQGFPLYHGALGENVTTRGLDRLSLRLRQRFRAGQAIIELTQVRLPCETLSVYGTGIQAAMYDGRAQAGDVASPVWGLSGFYASVVEPGILRPGDPIALLG